MKSIGINGEGKNCSIEAEGQSTVRNILIGSFERDFERSPPRIRPKRVILFFLLFSFPFKFTPGVLLEGFGRIEVIEKLSCPSLCFIAF